MKLTVIRCLVAFVAFLATAVAEDLSTGWQVLRLWKPETFRLIEVPQYQQADLPGADQPWMDWAASRQRAWRLEHPFQTGLPVWLQREVTLPADAASRTYVLTVRRGQQLLNGAWADGKPLADAGRIVRLLPQTPELERIGRDGWQPSVQSNRMNFAYWELGTGDDALLSLAGTSPGAHRILLHLIERTLPGEDLAQVELRRATAADLAVPYSYSVPVGDYGSELRAGLLQRLPGNLAVIARIRIEDRFGVVLRREERQLALDQPGEHGFVLQPASDREHKAVIEFVSDGVVVCDRWAYFHHLVQREGARTTYSLEGAQWEEKGFTMAQDEPTFPLDDAAQAIPVSAAEADAGVAVGTVSEKNGGGWHFTFTPTQVQAPRQADATWTVAVGKPVKVILRYDTPQPVDGYLDFVGKNIKDGQIVAVPLKSIGDKGEYQMRALPVILDAKRSEGWKPTYAPNARKRDCDHPFTVNGQQAHRMLQRRQFTLPADLRQSPRLVLRLSGIMEQATAWVNGVKAGRASFRDNAADFDVSAAVKRDGANELVILIDSWPAFATGGPYQDGAVRPSGLLGSSSLGGSFMNVRDDISIIGMPLVRATQTRIRAGEALELRTTIENTRPVAVQVAVHWTVTEAGKDLFSLDAAPQALKPGVAIDLAAQRAWPDAKRWSPWSPLLYGLRCEVLVDGKPVDTTLERFGVRTVTTKGTDILLNGQVVHFAGRLHSDSYLVLGMIDHDNLVQRYRDMRRQGVLIGRDMTGVFPAAMWGVMDEIGFLGGTQSLPWCNGQAIYRVKDPVAHGNFAAHMISYANQHGNHPSIVQWNYGNEMMDDAFSAPETQQLIGDVLRQVKANDPTRLTKSDGGGDPRGGADIIDKHYLRLSSMRQSTRSESKPTMTGEFSWNCYPLSSVFWSGEEGMKPSPIRVKRGWDVMSCEGLSMEAQRNADVRRYRAAGLAGFVTLSAEDWASNWEPVWADFHDDSQEVGVHGGTRRMWAGSQVPVSMVVANDSGRERAIVLRLLDGTSELWAQTVSLAQVGHRRVQATVAAPAAGEHRLTLTAACDGVVQTTRHQRLSVFERTSVGTVAKTTVAVLDGDGSVAKLLAAVGLQATPVAGVEVLAKDAPPLAIINGPVPVERAHLAARYVEQGGHLILLGQTTDLDWLPVGTLKARTASEGQPNLSLAYDPRHPVFAGLLAEDLRDWAPAGRVRASTVFEPPRAGSYRVLAGHVPETADLIEVLWGSGRAVVVALNLTPETVAADPAATRLWANLLRFASSPVPAPASAMLIGSGPRAAALREQLRVDAVAGGDPSGRQVVILADLDADPADPALAGQVKAVLGAGGTVLVDGLGQGGARWLAATTGVEVVCSAVFAPRAVKLDDHPLLAGIADGDLAFDTLEYSPWEQFLHPAAGGQDAVRVAVAIGSQRLTYPNVLATASSGRGRVIVNNLRWAEVERRTRAYWGYDAKQIGRGYMTKLLANLGVRCKPPEPPVETSLAGFAFTPLDLTPALNRPWVDDKAGDGKGWIDIGNNWDARELPEGPLVVQGVAYQLAAGRGGANAAIMLRSAKRFSDLPPVSEPIVVDRAVDGLSFLHAAGYLGATDGATAWTYEVRYQGFAKLVAGANTSSFIETVTVRTNVEVGDWLGNAFVKPAWRLEPKGLNLFSTFWRNPRPDIPVESIVVRSANGSEVPMVFAISAATALPNQLADLAVERIAPFRMLVDQYEAVEREGTWPGRWAFLHWAKGNRAEIALVPEPTTGKKSLRLVNVTGQPMGFFFCDKVRDVVPGQRLALTFRVLTAGDGNGELITNVGDGEQKLALQSLGQWKLIKVPLTATQAGKLQLRWQNLAMGAENAMYLKDFALYDAR